MTWPVHCVGCGVACPPAVLDGWHCSTCEDNFARVEREYREPGPEPTRYPRAAEVLREQAAQRRAKHAEHLRRYPFAVWSQPLAEATELEAAASLLDGEP